MARLHLSVARLDLPPLPPYGGHGVDGADAPAGELGWGWVVSDGCVVDGRATRRLDSRCSRGFVVSEPSWVRPLKALSHPDHETRRP